MGWFKNSWAGKTLKLITDSFVLQPLRGGNGVTQPNELAKWLITWGAIWMLYHEGITDGDQFTDYEFGIVFASIAAIAGVDGYFKKNARANRNDDSETSH